MLIPVWADVPTRGLFLWGVPMRKNIAEQSFEDEMRANGWETTKRGWPDFLAFKDNRVIFVEVKPTASQPLKPSQFKVFQLLAGAGFECYRYSPDMGLKPYKVGQPRQIPTIRHRRRGCLKPMCLMKHDPCYPPVVSASRSRRNQESNPIVAEAGEMDAELRRIMP